MQVDVRGRNHVTEAMRVEQLLPADGRLFFHTDLCALLKLHGKVEEIARPPRRRAGSRAIRAGAPR
jgi:hypothetical protein